MIPVPTYSWAEARFVYESMFLVGRQALKSGYDAILDGTFLREDYRAEATRKLARYYSAAIVICVLCDREVARLRNSQRNTTVPDVSFNRLSTSFEKPEKAIFVYADRRTPESAAGYVLHRLGIINERGGENNVVTSARETAA
jgi:predicted kinase